ncbi:MAG: TPM domain-containing protein [Ignavibacteriae bacterium]|nr:TPM domain-containing protein [Ignavibacteriota bacterium]
MKKLKFTAHTLFALLAFPFLVYGQKDDNAKSYSDNPTKLVQYVTDESGTLTSGEISTLSQKLKEFDNKTSTQIVVYMIQSLGGESLEDVSHRIAEKNKIGRKGKDNGVLLFIAKGDRKLRIEVGYGLEGVMTDAVSSQIIRKEITPSFKNNNFYEGIDKGTDAIIAVSKGEYTADKKSNKGLDGTTCLGLPIFIFVIFGIIFFSIFVSIIRRIFGFGRGIYSGGKRGGGWSNWGGGGFFGGGSSGSSGGFSGFSGGGGSFGGGGASGSW